jgi:DNA helicase II / ATP-dependent DNA helicase PcrA
MLQAMELREREYIQAAEQLKKAKVLHKSPYFGKIEIENEFGEVETLYIGLSTFRDPQNDDVYIFDWRAPISSLFYENTLGNAHYTIPDGEKIAVEIKGRRQFKVLYDKLLQILDADIYIGDEVLQNLLKDTAKEKMKSIVATIQSDQNAIIRASNKSNVIVLGPPGSGKTSVAMQRIAYLLYEYREQLNARNILLISPSDLFNDYISNVLPELGEENVRHSTFYRLWKEAKIAPYQAETNYENIERLQNGSEVERTLFAYKNSYEYATHLTRFVESLKTSGMAFYHLKIGEEMIYSSATLRKYFYDKFKGLDIDFRLKKMRTILLENLEKKKQVEYDFRLKALRNVNQYIGSDEELQVEARNDVNKKFGKLQSLIEQLKFVNLPKLYVQSLQSTNNLIAEETAQLLKQKRVYYEDLGPLLFLNSAIKKNKLYAEIKHIVIDEIQDYSYVQLLAIQQLHPKAHYSLLGDKNQIVHPERKDLLSPATLGNYDFIELNKSYRSTNEITNLMSAILNNTTTLSLGVKGMRPELFVVENEVAAIVSLIEQHYEEDDSFVILAKNMSTCMALYEKLQLAIPHIKLMTENERSYMKGILMMPGYMAKGFEFTTVVIADFNETVYDGVTDDTLLYTMTSRATRKLFFVSTKFNEMTQPLSHIAKDLYIKK